MLPSGLINFSAQFVSENILFTYHLQYFFPLYFLRKKYSRITLEMLNRGLFLTTIQEKYASGSCSERKISLIEASFNHVFSQTFFFYIPCTQLANKDVQTRQKLLIKQFPIYKLKFMCT